MAISISFRAETATRPRGRRALAAIAVLTLAVLGVATSRSSVFHARSVELTGTRQLTSDRVLRTAGVSEATNALWVDEGAVERRLEATPWIASADVRVAFPFTIRISIVERSPVAVARDGAGLVLMATDGTALGRVERRTDLPLIEATVAGAAGIRPDPVGAARALGAIPDAVRARIGRVRVLLDGTLEMWIEGGPRVEFGTPARAVRKGRAIAAVLGWAEDEGVTLRSVSVVEPSRPAVTLD